MCEPGEQTERTANEPRDLLSFAAAGERLGISADAARMRANRGKLATVETDGGRLVVWPQPATEHPNDAQRAPGTERTRSANRSPGREDARLVAALEDRIESLERQLAERSEEIRRRDHLIAGLIERVPELPATVPAQAAPGGSAAAQDAAAGGEPGHEPVRGLWARLRAVFGGVPAKRAR